MASGSKRFLQRFFIAGVLALILFLAASQTGIGDWLQPAFYAPYMGAALLSGNAHAINSLAFGVLLVLQCYLVVAFFGWAYGRLRRQSPEA